MMAAADLAISIDDDVDNAPHVVAGGAKRFDAENAFKLLPVDDGGWNTRLLRFAFFVIRRRWGGGVRLRGGRRLSQMPRQRFAEGLQSARRRAGRRLRAEQRKGDQDGRLFVAAAPAAKEAPRRGAERRRGFAPICLCRHRRQTQTLQTPSPSRRRSNFNHLCLMATTLRAFVTVTWRCHFDEVFVKVNGWLEQPIFARSSKLCSMALTSCLSCEAEARQNRHAAQ